MSQNFKQIISELKKKSYAPIYFLYGEEGFFIDQISDFIEDNVLDESEKAFNQVVLYGRDSTVDQIVETAKRYPMMSEYQVVIVKEAQSLPQIEELVNYIKNPSPSTILVIAHKYKKPDGRKPFFKEAKKTAILFESKKIYENQVPEWITNYSKSIGITINPKSTILLTEYLGNDLQKITNEIDKLKIVVGDGGDVNAQTIEHNIGISKDFNTFELQNALADKDHFKAHQIGRYFGENPKMHPIFMVLPVLSKFFVNVLAVQMIQNKTTENVARAIGVSPYFANDYLKASKAFTMLKLTQVISAITDCDFKSKGIHTTSMPAEQLYKELIYTILS